MNDLKFLDKFINTNKNIYESPSFLKSNFLDDVWTIEYSDKKTSIIDFRIKMGDDLLLTHAKHLSTLNTLKYWLIFHTLSNENERKSKSIMSDGIFAILTFFDAFNILKNETLIEKYGFEYLSNIHFKYILDLISSNSDKFLSLYQLKNRIFVDYLNKQAQSFIGTPSEKDIVDWEKFKDYYKNLLLKDLFPDTILKPVKKPNIEHIEISKQRITQEYDNILQDDDREEVRSLLSTRTFKLVLISLRELELNKNKFQYQLSLPNTKHVENIEHYSTVYKNQGRFKTIPSNIVFSYIKNAVEFHLTYGKDIVESYTSFYQLLKKRNYDFDNFVYSEELNDLFFNSLTPKLKKAGVLFIKSPNNMLYDGKERFNILRTNIYFYDLLKVYYGAVQIVAGALMARRQSELASLKVGECIDEHTSSLIFKQSKSTKAIFGFKNTLYLPIDSLGIEMIKNLEQIHINRQGEALFAIPTIKNIFSFNSSVTNTTYSENIDYFIDYFQAELKDGKRYYVRQHQLRRFFAMCFFWGSGFGSLDTLRWFMGHTNVEHVYHYITESTSGEILRNVKTQFLLENVEKYETLLTLIKNKYQTEQFDLIDSAELEEYISNLLENEEITVEPEFIQDNEKKDYKIVVKIKGEMYA